MRADRLLSILLLLQTHRKLSARALARRLEVSERTIQRDMDALGAAGVPVVAERGAGGGWSLMEGYDAKPTGLNEAEIQTLFVGRPLQLLADLGLRGAAESAFIKLLAALPSVQRRDAEYARQRIHVDMTGWRQSPEDVSVLPLLQEAIWQERKARLSYQRGDGTTVERVVDPLGLVAKGSVWYLVAAVEGETRTYRVARAQTVTVVDEPCVRPAGFDLAAYWAQSTSEFIAQLPRYRATLRIAPDVLPRLRLWRYAQVEATGEPDAHGWRQVSVMFQTLEEASEYVLGCGPWADVLEPAELRARVIAQAQAIVAFYATRSPAAENRG